MVTVCSLTPTYSVGKRIDVRQIDHSHAYNIKEDFSTDFCPTNVEQTIYRDRSDYAWCPLLNLHRKMHVFPTPIRLNPTAPLKSELTNLEFLLLCQELRSSLTFNKGVKMAELLGAVVAGAQAFDYTLQLCETIDKIFHAASSQKRYQQTSQQLICILKLIRASPHLQTPEILSCIKDLICTVDDVYSTLCRRRRNRFVASIAFVIKQKSYDDIFTYLEHQKATLALHISRLNANTLGELTATSNDIWIKIQSFYEQSLRGARIEAASPLSPSSTPRTQIPVETSDHQQEKCTVDGRSLDADIRNSSQANCPSSAMYKHYLPSDLSLAGEDGSSPELGAEDVKEQMSLQVNDLSFGKERDKDKVGVSMARHVGGRETQPAHALDSSNTTTTSVFKGNIQMSDSLQIVGIKIGQSTCITDADLISVTSGLRAHSNIHAGKGTQVIGQRVCAGAKPRIFTGQYCDNINRGGGEQIIGFSLE